MLQAEQNNPGKNKSLLLSEPSSGSHLVQNKHLWRVLTIRLTRVLTTDYSRHMVCLPLSSLTSSPPPLPLTFSTPKSQACLGLSKCQAHSRLRVYLSLGHSPSRYPLWLASSPLSSLISKVTIQEDSLWQYVTAVKSPDSTVGHPGF